MKERFIYLMILTCMVSLNACGKNENTGNENSNGNNRKPGQESPAETESESASLPESTAPLEITTLEDLSSEQMQWHVYISPDTPEPYIEVLEQYEQFMNADDQDLNDDNVWARFQNGEWKYLYDELCGVCLSSLERTSSNPIQYAFQDLTDDGFPEMIMAYGDTPYIIYHYSETNGIQMEYASSYFTMTIYENHIVEYVSAGMYSSTTYLQFQEDADAWIAADIIAVDSTWDSVNDRTIDIAYYGGSWGDDGRLTDTLSREQYLQIQDKYVTEPMEFDWIPFTYNKSEESVSRVLYISLYLYGQEMDYTGEWYVRELFGHSIA